MLSIPKKKISSDAHGHPSCVSIGDIIVIQYTSTIFALHIVLSPLFSTLCCNNALMSYH